MKERRALAHRVSLHKKTPVIKRSREYLQLYQTPVDLTTQILPLLVWATSHNLYFFLLLSFLNWLPNYYMVVWGLSNIGGLATTPRWQKVGWAVAPSQVK